MKKLILFAVMALVVAVGANAYAELKNVEVGGSIRLRGDIYDPSFFNDHNPGDDFLSTTTRLNISAEMTDGVSAFIELQQINIWGDQIGDDGWSSVPGAPPSLTDEDGFSLYRGYILIEDVGDNEGLSLKIGRQELTYGTEFILGNNDFGPGLSHDAIAAIYVQDDMRVDLFAAKVAEGRTMWGTEDDADVDLFGIYSTYTGMEDYVVDAYLLFARAADWGGAGPIYVPPPQVPTETDPSQLWTLGARVGGVYEALDYNGEAAFQFGDNGWGGDYEGWALDAGVGYSFDYECNPRLGLNYTFSSGDDGEFDDDTETFLAPFADNYHRYGYMDLFGLGNLNVLKLSVTAEPTEKIGVGCHLLHFLAVEHEDNVAPYGGAGGANANSDTVGTELDLVADYAYSEDLSFELAFAHFWASGYTRDAFGQQDDDMYRIYLQAKLVF
ncbi:MAG: alginate export family protein [Candidatus Hydrogenedentes bacterium]|nr:alginate export family protein [Candidatus Hydrogenedentota bacterium]